MDILQIKAAKLVSVNLGYVYRLIHIRKLQYPSVRIEQENLEDKYRVTSLGPF